MFIHDDFSKISDPSGLNQPINSKLSINLISVFNSCGKTNLVSLLSSKIISFP